MSKEAYQPDMDGFLKTIRNPLKFRLFLFTRLPSAYFSGLKVASVTTTHTAVTVPYKWFSKNPFRSTYFACLAMAAEMSTGILAMAYTNGVSPGISMLVVGMEARFLKKGTGLTTFFCQDGERFRDTIRNAVVEGESQQLTATSIGKNEAGEIVAEFDITWSFRQRTAKA